jgi:hypothetical protein
MLSRLLPNLGNIIPLWNLPFVLKMLIKSPRLNWPSVTSWLMTSLTDSTPFSTSLAWFRIWKPIGIAIFYQSGVFSRLLWVLRIPLRHVRYLRLITSWCIAIWCGVRCKLANKNFKDSNLFSSMVNEGLTCSMCSLLDILLSTTGSLIIVVTTIGIIKVWTGKSMIS